MLVLGQIMHNKYSIIDSKILISGSYNYSLNAKWNHENIIVQYNQDIINQFIDNFVFLKGESESILNLWGIGIQQIQKENSIDVNTEERVVDMSILETAFSQLHHKRV
jgi:phosphatidylserine/phosphatidylglycerophosphate/cardiolipin synthase-like enzyme